MSTSQKLSDLKPSDDRHEDDEFFDHVEINCIERWKESELSGDEWRFSYEVSFWRKGQKLLSAGFSKLDWALDVVPYLRNTYNPGINERHVEFVDKDYCMQPGCSNKATIEYRKIKDWCNRCGNPHEITYFEKRRRFCNSHKRRGDCGLDDSDANYEVVYIL